jgi:hypothetical protein
MITKKYTNKEPSSHVRWLHRMVMQYTGGLMEEKEIEKSWAIINKFENNEQEFKK